MAQYGWKCNKCESVTTITRKMDDYKVPPDDPCECGSKEFTKQISGGTSFNLEGGGWYKDWY